MKPEDILVSTEWLAAHLGDAKIRIVDLRWSLDDNALGRQWYAQSHIPGAVYLDWLEDLSDPNDPVEGQVAPPERFKEVMEQAGITDDTLVVAYDDNLIFMGARLLWCFHYYGHDNIRILNGGFPKWEAEQRPVTSAPPAPRSGRFTLTMNTAIRQTKEDVLHLIDTGAAQRGETQIFDCRLDRTWDEAGLHIPGARRLPSLHFMADDRTWRSLSDLARINEQADVRADAPMVLYCGGGVSSALVYTVQKLLGYERVAVYDGSWSEWGADPETPKEKH